MTVNNPDAVFNKAISAGAVQVWPIVEDYGWRIGRIVDRLPLGNWQTINRKKVKEFLHLKLNIKFI